MEDEIRERLMHLIEGAVVSGVRAGFEPEPYLALAADAILREFALRPVSQGTVDSESGEVRT